MVQHSYRFKSIYVIDASLYVPTWQLAMPNLSTPLFSALWAGSEDSRCRALSEDVDPDLSLVSWPVPDLAQSKAHRRFRLTTVQGRERIER